MECYLYLLRWRKGFLLSGPARLRESAHPTYGGSPARMREEEWGCVPLRGPARPLTVRQIDQVG